MKKYLIIFIILTFLTPGCDKKNSEPALPDISIKADEAQEGNDANTSLTVNFQLSAPAAEPVTFSYSTSDLTARAGSDYISVNNKTVEIPAGETSKPVTIEIIADTLMEFTEQFNLSLSDIKHATSENNSITIGIRDDDGIPVSVKSDGYDVPETYPGMSQTWADEFNGTLLNEDDWNYELGGGGWGNNELEVYTDKPENVYIDNGKLVIKAIYNNSTYTSGRLTTQGKQEFRYGLIQIRAKLPYGQGIWPALWMLGANINDAGIGWPKCGETDIMELVGDKPSTVYGTAHWEQDGHQYQGGSYILPTGKQFSGQFHVFSLLWEQDRIVWYVDSHKFYEFSKNETLYNWPFNNPFFFIFNVAVGGYWPGNPDDTTVFPQTMTVDYIRVYKPSRQ